MTTEEWKTFTTYIHTEHTDIKENLTYIILFVIKLEAKNELKKKSFIIVQCGRVKLSASYLCVAVVGIFFLLFVK